MISAHAHGTGEKELREAVHVWYIAPESVRESSMLQRCRDSLDNDERQRLARFVFPADGHRYLVSHAMVRSLLSRYADIAPQDWRFSRGAHGRPEITNSTLQGLRFNLTHTDGLAACIVTLDDDCGIDAERIARRNNLPGIAQRMFSTQEQEQLKSFEGRAFMTYFYQHWTLREAYVKARGIGISFPTRQIRFEVNGERITAFFDTHTVDHGDNWHFQLLRPDDEHIVALALRRTADRDKRIVAQPFTFSD